jgi:hypothetical protein
MGTNFLRLYDLGLAALLKTSLHITGKYQRGVTNALSPVSCTWSAVSVCPEAWARFNFVPAG